MASALATAPIVAAAPADAVVTPPTVVAVNNLPVLASQGGPLGDVSITESVPGQIHAGDVLTFQFQDSASNPKIHFSTAGTVSGTNGLTATVAVASSNISGPALNDEMKVTITATSATSSFPGVLTLSGLSAAVDSSSGTGNDKVIVSDSLATLGAPVTVADANVLALGTQAAPFAALATPTIVPTLAGQAVGNIAITEPVKSFFSAGDVITFAIRDVNGSANTIGLATTPYAAGGSMTVSVSGANGPSVQANDTSFNVNVVAGDPSNGSTSTITVSNIVVNAAEAPLGPVTLSAFISAGPGAGTKFIVPGRVSVANVGGNTTTTAPSAPILAASTPAQLAGNVIISATPGSLNHGDVISLHIQSTGVTFNTTNLPIASVTSGSVVFANAAATLSASNTTASWTVSNGDAILSTIAIGPIYYDVSGSAAPSESVNLLASAQPGSAFTSQVVTNAFVAPSNTGTFTTATASIPSTGSAPYLGAPVTYKESAAGATGVGASIVLLSPSATQIAAFRTTFTSIPTIAATGGLTFSAPKVNSSSILVDTAQGTVTAPAQTAAIFTVTAASTSASTVTISSLAFTLGDLVQPGTLVVTGAVEQAGSLTNTLNGNQVVDLVNTRNLGTSAATTPPTATITQFPASLTNVTSATFAFSADQYGSTFECALDGVVISLTCPSPITLPSLTNGSHTFYVEPINIAGYPGAVASYTWTIDTTAPTATIVAPTTLSGPVTVTFSKPVSNVSALTVTLAATADPAPPVAVPSTMTCTTADAITGPCVTGTFYVSTTIQPSTPLVPGQSYVVTANPSGALPAIADGANNALGLTTVIFRGALSQEENSTSAVVNWSTIKNASTSGGSYAVANLKGATTSFTFTGTQVTWTTVTGPNQGRYAVTIDGVTKGTALNNNNYATALHYKVARTYGGLALGTHTIVITALGTKGATTATDTQVAVDNFAVSAVVTEQSASTVTYAWEKVSVASASGGSYVVDDLAGANFHFTFVGTGVKWFTVTGPTMGQAQVVIDGVVKATVNNYSAATIYKVARSYTGLTPGVHTLVIVVLGKHLAPATSNKVAVDSFTVS